MPTSLLTTKLYIPPTRPELVSRPYLIKRLNEGLYRKLSLISAPAGFGKTTLISEWVDTLRLDGPKESQIETKITRNIYGKPGVNSQMQAVDRARAITWVPEIGTCIVKTP